MKITEKGVTYQEVTLWSTEPDAVDAFTHTLAYLGSTGIETLIMRDGRFFIPEGYVLWACTTQGYVRGVVV